MSTFKLEVGGNCANGARVVCLFFGRFEGVVLAEYHGEYVTWVFNNEIQDCTAHGNYFRDNSEEAYEEATKDFIERVSKYISH